MVNSSNTIIIIDPVNDFIYSLDEATFAKILKMLELLGDFGIRLKMPYSKKINDKLYELRIRGKREVRIIYIFTEEKIILLYGFVKKSEKIPKKEIKLAIARFKGLTI